MDIHAGNREQAARPDEARDSDEKPTVDLRTTIVSYEKLDGGGTRVVRVEKRDLNATPEDMIDRYQAFFTGVPLHGGKEWESLSVPEIVEIFQTAADEIVTLCADQRQAEIDLHNQKGRVRRWFSEAFGWKAPESVSLEQVLQSMIDRCRSLADWMNKTQHRPFYQGSDMSAFIVKPRQVASALERGLSAPQLR